MVWPLYMIRYRYYFILKIIKKEIWHGHNIIYAYTYIFVYVIYIVYTYIKKKQKSKNKQFYTSCLI